MPAKTLYLLDVAAGAGGHGSLQDGGAAPTDADTATAFAQINNNDRQTYGTSIVPATAVNEPAGAPNLAGDSWRTQTALSGSFAAGVWDLSVNFTSNNQDAETDRLQYRIWRSVNTDGSAAAEISAGIVLGSDYLNTNTFVATAQASTASPSLSATTLTNEYLFFQVAVHFVASGVSIGSTWTLRVGSASRIITPVFTAGGGGSTVRLLASTGAGN